MLGFLQMTEHREFFFMLKQDSSLKIKEILNLSHAGPKSMISEIH